MDCNALGNFNDNLKLSFKNHLLQTKYLFLRLN
jgi:hypothetical protein